MPDAVSKSAVATTSRASKACINCRQRKVKCNGGQPCSNCRRHDSDCMYLPSFRRKHARKESTVDVLESRIARMESLLQSSVATNDFGSYQHPSTVDLDQPSQPPNRTTDQIDVDELTRPTDPLAATPARTHSDDTNLLSTDSFNHVATGVPPTSTLSSPNQALQARQPLSLLADAAAYEITNSEEDPQTVFEEELVLPLEPQNCWEHHGPSAWVSICSQPGLRWVCAKTGSTEFIDSAKRLIYGWTCRLRWTNDKKMEQRIDEPEKGLAWKYCNAYFENCYDAVFGVLNRRDFENRLRNQFQSAVPPSSTDEPSWFALRNIVYASGYRSILAQDASVSFPEAQNQSWRYFENAFSVYRDLLFRPTGLIAVQALILMAFYVEGLGSPALEYMLCSDAVRAAQGKGLHRQPSSSWGLSQSDILQRNWLFWAIYCCDKQIAFRSGRPSAIDDDNISCSIPTEAPKGSTIDVQMFDAIIRHAKISSQISKQLMSATTFKKPSMQLLKTVIDLDKQLRLFCDNLPAELRPDRPIRSRGPFQSSSRLTQIAYLHFAYQGSLIATHVIFGYPWLAGQLHIEDEDLFRNQISISSGKMAHAARCIIMNTGVLIINATTPAFLAFYYPILAHISLFTFVLKNITVAAAGSDVDVLDVCAGHFGNLAYSTSSELAFPFAREAVTSVYAALKRAKDRINDNENNRQQAGGETNFDSNNAHGSNEIYRAGQNSSFGGLPDDWNEIEAFIDIDFDIESSNIFSNMNSLF